MSNQHVTRPGWLRRTSEAVIEPERPICDPHHHLWDRPNNRYLVEDLVADLGSGHNIVSTVFVECGAGYRPDGAEALRPVGETEFVVREVERAAATLGSYSNIAAGIVSFADLRLGAGVERVLAAHTERVGVAFAAFGTAWPRTRTGEFRRTESSHRRGCWQIALFARALPVCSHSGRASRLGLITRSYPSCSISQEPSRRRRSC